MDPVTYRMNLTVVAQTTAQYQKALEDAYKEVGASVGVIPQLVQAYAAVLMDAYGLLPERQHAQTEEKPSNAD